MFPETSRLSHENMYTELQKILAQISPKDIADAFLYSLSTRALEYRSAMGSYYFAKAIPPHKPVKECACGICGWENWKTPTKFYSKNTYENFHNFDRHKFGGRHHNEIDYALFDLSQFLKLPKVRPTETDKELLRQLLAVSGELTPKQKAGAYQKLLVSKKIIPSNAIEISSLLDILGYCGILSTSEY